MSWTAILVLAGGSYLFKALGLVVFGPAMQRGAAGPGTGRDTDMTGAGQTTQQVGVMVRLGQLLPPALLAALVVSQTVATGTELVIDARLAGVAAGALGVWKGAPFWLVLIIAAAVAAAIRLVAA